MNILNIIYKIFKFISLMIIGLDTIRDCNAIENQKMVEENVVKEYNGVYGGKWHIVSPEGFDLPEGLEYLKKAGGTVEERITFIRKDIFKYSAKIKISHIDLYTSLKKVSSSLEDAWIYDAYIEFKDCPRKCSSLKIPYLRMFPFVSKLKLSGCILTYKDLKDFMHYSIGNNRELYLSENTFEDGGCAKSVSCIEQQIDILKSIQECYNVIDLRKCNFSDAEKEMLKKKLKYIKNLLL